MNIYQRVFFLMTIILSFSSCKDSSEKEYYENGMIKKEYSFNNNGNLHGESKSFYENGKLKSFYHYKNGLKEGVAEWYYPTGELELKLEYKSDKMNGNYESYYRNGRFKEIAIAEQDSIVFTRKFDSLGVFLEEFRVISFSNALDSSIVGGKLVKQFTFNGEIDENDKLRLIVYNDSSHYVAKNVQEVNGSKNSFEIELLVEDTGISEYFVLGYNLAALKNENSYIYSFSIYGY